ncbi:52 kDa repressor of the inhibitor of the protein kinase-like [Oopsacas minuta]|uniref:52 kDa repressor of the inhibitor of the protein kinase-like n=1 Tax=Oopsacas minuta TaxID=111878 RepID=A0AAV7KFH7_9METZ|nr:52 kDa repressor of the inhibitor of the protein kinase-like [Oopsacas minuta]
MIGRSLSLAVLDITQSSRWIENEIQSVETALSCVITSHPPSDKTSIHVSSTNCVIASSSTTTKLTGGGEVLATSDSGELQGKKLSDVEKITSVSNLLTKENEAIKMTESSVKRHNIYKQELRELHNFIDEDDIDASIEIPLAYDTRWISHSECLKGVKKKSDCEYDEKKLKIWRSNWCSIIEKDKPTTACETLVCMSKDTFPNIYSALAIVATMLVSTATAERSFSTLKRLKTCLRNTMCQSRLTGLALMHLHKNIDVDVELVLLDFDPLNDRRILLAFD